MERSATSTIAWIFFAIYFLDKSPVTRLEIAEAADALNHLVGFTPEITDGYERVENFKSSLAVLRRILGLWRRSMYSNTSALAASSVGYVMR